MCSIIIDWITVYNYNLGHKSITNYDLYGTGRESDECV